MALKPCKSCKHTVDTTAKICPSCGVKNPGVTVGQQVFGLVILLVIIAVTFSMCSGATRKKQSRRLHKVMLCLRTWSPKTIIERAGLERLRSC